jgi:tetratricopeptide (TPR) repeat protein
MNDRLSKLMGMLGKQPDDPFLNYAIALEHKKARQHAEAVSWFAKTLEKDPGYVVAYHQAGLTHEDAGDLEAAKKAYREGIAAARGKGDHHAAEEMQAALSMIE